MVKSRLMAASIAAAILVAAAPPESRAAESAIEVGVGSTVLVTLARPARAVVVGDPAVADVSVEGPTQVVVFGKRAGGTSLTVLGAGRAVLVDARVVVHPGGAGAVTVTYGAGKQVEPGGRVVVYACATTCVRVADDRKAPTQPAKAGE